MTGPLHADKDTTPLTPAERDDLIPTHVTLRSELDELEQQNIAEADGWAFSRKRNVLHEGFLRGLHRRMFDGVWRWAGKYRTTERNFGVAPFLIQPELVRVIQGARYWIDYQSYAADELAVRYHHGLVTVHPFPNGNGRCAAGCGFTGRPARQHALYLGSHQFNDGRCATGLHCRVACGR